MGEIYWVQTIEDGYWKTDKLIEDKVDELIINLSEDSDDSDDFGLLSSSDEESLDNPIHLKA